MKARAHITLLLKLYISLLPYVVHSEVLDVPGEFPSIQGALQASQPNDTIRVAPGTYHEFLSSPFHHVLLTGWHPGDTLPEFRTVLDPIPIDPVPSVAIFNGDSAEIRNFAFYNRPEMREHEIRTRTGGILFYGEVLRLHNCLFDSVSSAVQGGNRIVAKYCTFQACLWQCISPNIQGAVECENSVFDGGDVFWLVQCFSNSSIRNCRFICNTSRTDLLKFSGENIEVVGCWFGPCYSAFPILRGTTTGDCRIEGCVFEGIERASALIEVSMDCRTDEGAPISIRGNRFQNYQGIPPANGTNTINLNCQNYEHGYFGLIEDNIFEDGFSISAPGVNISGSVDIVHNSFTNLQPDSIADVKASQRDFDTIRARDNQFYEPGIAAISAGAYFDASENWWGDSTGPFHPSLNPDGQGTEVGNGVIFEPWLIQHPDSADTNSNSIVQPVLLPNEFTLSAFPNPFNATTTLSIQVSRPGVYDVVLYDVTGRETAKLFKGEIAATHDVQINAKTFATGIYFARLIGEGSELAVAKLVLLK